MHCLVSQPDLNWTGDWRSMGANGDESPYSAVIETMEELSERFE
jgi:hypothetical protein